MARKHVIVIGAGLGGLTAAIKAREAGHEVTVLERNPRVGGTWYENTYPGVACDVPVALYQLSFAQSMNWTRAYPQGAEIQAYAEELADRFQLRPHLRLGEAATEARWDAERRVWTVTSEAGNTYVGDVLVGALGQLNRPYWPDIPGRDDFQGICLHSARWDPAADWAGKRVCVIGSAASAVQLIPQMAKDAAHLTVFQRTPNWVIPRRDVPITDAEKALQMTRPDLAMELAERNRKTIWETADQFFWQAFSWTPEGRAAYETVARNHLEEQVPDPALRAKLTPDYPVGCKRILISDDFYPALMRDNVSLVTDGIDRIDAAGVIDRAGRRHDCDILVFATGFETTGWHWSVDVIGETGESLARVWEDAPEAYLGITVAGFPNFFVLYGPNTNLGHNSITFMIECQVAYMLRALETLEARGATAMAPRRDAQDRYNAELQASLAQTVWADPHCNSWYKTDDGRITQNWSSNTQAYAKATATVAEEDYAFA